MPRPRKNEMVALYADFSRKGGAMEIAAQQTRERLLASTRPDMAGAAVNQYQLAQNYQQRVAQVWAAYGSDPLFGRLINRFIEFSANGSAWEVPSETQENSWLTRLKNWTNGRESKLEREEDVWNMWSEQLNRGVPNVLPGLNEVVRWAVKHMLLSAMFVPHWEIGEMRVGKQTYLVPTKMTCYPGSSITLQRSYALFSQENIYLYRPSMGITSMHEGNFFQAPNFLPLGGIPNNKNIVELPGVSGKAKLGATESFALKYNWSPGDLVSYRRGATIQMGTGIYPQPPFSSLMPQFAIRQKLFSADAAILDGVINFIMMYKIGDKDHPPKPAVIKRDGTVEREGTIETVRRLIMEGQAGPAMQLFVPYYVDLDIKIPAVETLLSDTKYGASATEIFQAFGIFFSRTQSGNREKMENITLSGFEEFINGIRLHVKAFLELLAWHIVEINQGKLRVAPQWAPNPINTKSEEFIKELLELKKVGMISAKTLLRYVGVDNDVEVRRIVGELATDVDDIHAENVPVSFIQETVQPDTGGTDPRPPAPTPPIGKPAPTGKPAGPVGKPEGPIGKAQPTGTNRKRVAIPPTKQTGRPRS